MGIVVNSPYSGRPVKIRDQDVGRAVRDEENRIFYVLERAEGGHYGSITRVGGPKEESRYDEMVAKMQTARETGQTLSQQQVQDRTGRRRANKARLVVVLILLIAAVAGAVWLFTDLIPGSPGSQSTQQQQAPEQTPAVDEQPQSSLPNLRGQGEVWVHEAATLKVAHWQHVSNMRIAA